jgi:ribosome-associated protein
VNLNELEIARDIVNTLEEMKGENILLLDIQEIASFTDYFIICSGTSDRMLASLAKTVVTKVKTDYGIRKIVEGEAKAGWMVIDLANIIVHLFSPDQREYYKLEQLWGEGKVLLHLQ